MTPDQFKTVRLRLTYTQADLARILGVKEPTIWRWEHGHRAIPLMAERFVELLLRLHKARIAIE